MPDRGLHKTSFSRSYECSCVRALPPPLPLPGRYNPFPAGRLPPRLFSPPYLFSLQADLQLGLHVPHPCLHYLAHKVWAPLYISVSYHPRLRGLPYHPPGESASPVNTAILRRREALFLASPQISSVSLRGRRNGQHAQVEPCASSELTILKRPIAVCLHSSQHSTIAKLAPSWILCFRTNSLERNI
jgi:hypothetical protein